MHIAIIMDGNGRWATGRHLPRTAGHREGANAVDRIVQAAAEMGIGTLTLYAFSAANWQRPAGEVNALFGLFRRYLLNQTERCAAQSIRLNVVGRRDRLDASLLRIIQHSEQATAACEGMRLRIAVDYSSRHSLLNAALRLARDEHGDASAFESQLAAVDHSSTTSPAVDLLIRTGGEKRLSDFLLYECAYAELLFTERLWPDFDAADLRAAVADFASRDRRFGNVHETSSAEAQHG